MKLFRGILGFVPVVAGMVSCTSAVSETKEASKKVTVPAVEVAAVQQLQPRRQAVLPGELKPWNRVSIHAKIKGFVRGVQVDRGTWVRKGQVLAQLDAPEILSELSQAKAQVLAQEAALVEQTSRYRASRLTYQRLLQTSKTEGAVSANEIDQSQARMQADSAMVSVAQGNVQAGRSNLQAKSELAHYLTITAPFDGMIIERNISPGALVGAGDAGKPLFVLEDSRTLRLTVAIPETFTNQLVEKSGVSFAVSAIPEKQFSARLARDARSLVEENRAMIAEFDVNNASHELKAGMYAEVRLPLERPVRTLFVPTSSVVSSSEKVFVIRVKDNKAIWVPVEKGVVVDSLVEVFGSLQVGESIVRVASEELRDGQAIKVQ
ncbi:efflux RND transporter periplasmic adaptor subunit [Tellurirhabdus bombi]|uniref:efflux RND transporter periplasmic adaptor subunit n=1 Tax=Tellurirhabdus bombi TaxID=2907205 RepID=UPI001F224503|nr:efflux RND transporter periplasmic adaptor subunit [Tellurirhabdus bombi]